MNDKGMDFRKKEVINITDATRLGYVQDVCADLETGRITSSSNDIVIEWEKIRSIGDDLILVEL